MSGRYWGRLEFFAGPSSNVRSLREAADLTGETWSSLAYNRLLNIRLPHRDGGGPDLGLTKAGLPD